MIGIPPVYCLNTYLTVMPLHVAGFSLVVSFLTTLLLLVKVYQFTKYQKRHCFFVNEQMSFISKIILSCCLMSTQVFASADICSVILRTGLFRYYFMPENIIYSSPI